MKSAILLISLFFWLGACTETGFVDDRTTWMPAAGESNLTGDEKGTEPSAEDKGETDPQDDAYDDGEEEKGEPEEEYDGDGDGDGEEEEEEEEKGEPEEEFDGDGEEDENQPETDNGDAEKDTPVQNGNETETGEEENEEEKEEEPPEEPCVWLPAAGKYSGTVPGLPGNLKINAADYKDDADVILDNDEYFIFLVRVYFKRKNKKNFDFNLKGGKGYHHTDYTVTISSPKSNACEIEAASKGDRRTAGGCFDPATRIRMADGKDKNVMTLKRGDLVLNPRTGKPLKITKIVDGPEKDKPMMEIGVGTRMIRVTMGHPFETRHGLASAQSLRKGDKIAGPGGRLEMISFIRSAPIRSGQMVRNFIVDGGADDKNHMILANGILTGDLHLQQKLLRSKAGNIATVRHNK